MVSSATAPIPSQWASALSAALLPDESVQAWLATDLSDNLLYSNGLVAVTQCRLLTFSDALDSQPEVWQLSEIATFRLRENFGVGTLDALGSARISLAGGLHHDTLSQPVALPSVRTPKGKGEAIQFVTR